MSHDEIPRIEADLSEQWYGNMTMRDWFAGQAMVSMVAGDGARMVADIDERYDGMSGWAGIVASNAYEFADAMLEARKPKPAPVQRWPHDRRRARLCPVSVRPVRRDGPPLGGSWVRVHHR